jgi:dihydrofolate synthase/folylpolyglutamate synthase
MAYHDTIEYLYGLQKHGVKLGLSNSEALLEALGAPHDRFRSVHIAGTNGKGSTAAFLASILGAAGLRTGLYTSPHLVSFTERIRVDGVPVPEETVVELAERARSAWRRTLPGRDGTASPTFFEVTTAMAFAHFAERSVDIAVVETGMGGRLDATNVITPLASVITTVDFDHMEFLGATLREIAGEKAGIIKPGVPVVLGVCRPDADAVLEQAAKERNAPIYRREKDFSASRISPGRTTTFDYRGTGSSYAGLTIAMTGRHQVDNACLAIATVECLRGRGGWITEEALRSGLGAARWEGRLERVALGPDIFLDGAHNPAAARALAAAIRDMKGSYGKCIFVVGILADKDARGILAELLPLADEVVLTRPQYSRAMDLSTLASEARAFRPSLSCAPSVDEAISAARGLAGPDDLIVITGSLYVVGEARAVLVRGHETPALQGLRG